MRFFSITALLALAASVVAQTGDKETTNYNSIFEPKNGAEVAVGKTLSIQWAVGTVKPTGKVKILLKGGPTDKKLEAVETIATGVDNSALKYDWVVSSKAAGKALYGIQMVAEDDESVWQWSQPFKITGGSSSSGSGSSTASPSSSTVTSGGPTSSSATTSVTGGSGPGDATPAPGPQPTGNSTGGPVVNNPGTGAPRPGAGVKGVDINGIALLMGLGLAVLAL